MASIEIQRAEGSQGGGEAGRSRAVKAGEIALIVLVATYFLLLTWGANPPLLDGDDAVYLLMADFFSPFSTRDESVTDLVMRHSYFPPLYPLLLSVFGGVATNTMLAHAVTVATLFLAYLALYVWARSIGGRPIYLLLLVVVAALLPATVPHLFALQSEGLYLALSLAALFFANRNPDDRYWQLSTAVVVGLAILSRTVGFTLWLAYTIWLVSNRREGWKTLPVAALLPWMAWTAWKWVNGYTASYSANVTDHLSQFSASALVLQQILIAPLDIWRGWVASINHLETPVGIVGATVVGGLCLAGLIRRLWLRSFDGFYISIYLAVVLIWPYSYVAPRLLFAALPILLVQGLVFMEWIGSQETKLPKFGRHASAMFVGMIGISAGPAVLTIQERLIAGMMEANRPYATAASWYIYPDIEEARTRIAEQTALVHGWSRFEPLLGENDCVYHLKPVPFMLYTNRRAYLTPYATSESEFWEQAIQCRYFYLGAFIYAPYRESFYPSRFLASGTRVYSIEQVEENGRKRPVGILVRANIRHSK